MTTKLVLFPNNFIKFVCSHATLPHPLEQNDQHTNRWQCCAFLLLLGTFSLLAACSSVPPTGKRNEPLAAQNSTTISPDAAGNPASTVAAIDTNASSAPTPVLAAAPAGAMALPPVPEKVVDVTFQDVTAAAGIHFKHNNGAYGKKYLPETMGAGCAWLDYDNDGWQDALFINGMDFADAPKKRKTTLALYHNNQNGTFSDVTASAGLAGKQLYGMGAAIGDYDNDGNTDIFVTAVGQNALFRNLGNGKFTEATAKVGLGQEWEFSASAAWLDYDKDGKLDLFVCNYVDWQLEKDRHCSLDGTNKSYCTPEAYKGQPSRLYRNTGGKFEDATQRAGVFDANGKAMGVAVVDYNQDGWLDLFVSNDTQPNKLYKNNGNGTFTETGVTAGVAFSEEGKARAGMGVDFADYDGSGFPSLIVGNFSNEMLGVYHNEGAAGLFIDEAPSSAIGQATMLTLTFGLFFFDYDLDGQPDIFLANGHVADDINKVQPKLTHALTPKLFRNEGKRKFAEVSRKAGKPFAKPIVARGAAYADYDNDGDLDILVTTNGGAATLWRNEGGNQQRFVQFKTIGEKSNRAGLGAKITLTLADGSKQWQTVHSGSSYCSQSQLLLTFGLGRNDKITKADIVWPNGKTDQLANLTANQRYTVKEAGGAVEGKPLPFATPTPTPTASAAPLATLRP